MRVVISVVIPAFNEEKLLPQCLESLKNQDYKDGYEIIIVDNGSTDNTGKVAREFGSRVILYPEKGVVYARQMGVYSALGAVVGTTIALKPIHLLPYLLAGLTVIYGIGFAIRRLIGGFADRRKIGDSRVPRN